MKQQNYKTFLDYILKEWLVLVSFAGLVITSIYFRQIPRLSVKETEVLFLIIILFVNVKGLENSGIVVRLSQLLERGRFVPLKLVLITFFLSMLITNDVSLIIIVPVTLLLEIKRKDILIIFEALSANAGSALTPIGNPQNLFIYWFYNINPKAFISEIFPFSILFLLILIILSLFLTNNKELKITEKTVKIEKRGFIYAGLFLILILSVLHLLPVWSGLFIFIYSLIFDRKSLKIDYALILTFLFFFGLAANLKNLFLYKIENPEHIFIFSALLSQIISNVPAALLFAKFTTNWKALLWGVNTGGFGSLFGSLANLIAYKLYVNHKDTNNILQFTLKFLVIGYVFLFAGLLFYFCIN